MEESKSKYHFLRDFPLEAVCPILDSFFQPQNLFLGQTYPSLLALKNKNEYPLCTKHKFFILMA